jgi:hypothetical protein
MKFIKTSLFFVCLIFSPCGYSMTIDAQVDSLSYSISILNSKEELTSEQIVLGHHDSEFSKTNSIDNIGLNKLLWLRIDLKNETQHTDWALVLNPSIPYITFHDNGDIKKTGAHVPFNSKNVGTDDNVIRLSIEGGKSRSVYLKIEDHRGLNKIPVMKFIPWESWQIDKSRNWSKVNFITGFYLGSTLLLSIALLFFYKTTKDPAYMWLGLYLICDIIYEMGVQGYYWFIIGGIPQFFWIIQSTFLAGFYFGLFQFLRNYFNLKVLSPVWNKVFIGIIFMFIVWFALRIFFPDLERIRSIIILSVAVLTIIFFIKLLLDKNPIVIYVFWGSITFFMSLIIAILLYNFNIKFISYNIIVKLGVIAQVVLYFLGLSNKVKLINENLEKLVQERTDKISQQNQKLIDYAFRNAHNVRGPLARILGLVNLISIEHKETNSIYVSRLSESAEELDSSIKDMSKLLEEEDFIKMNDKEER